MMDSNFEAEYLDFDEIFVKKECSDYEELSSESETGSKITFGKNLTAKCGEVMIGQKGDFTFVCALCSVLFDSMQSFGLHVQDVHMHLESGCVSGQDEIVTSVSIKPLMILDVEHSIGSVPNVKPHHHLQLEPEKPFMEFYASSTSESVEDEDAADEPLSAMTEEPFPDQSSVLTSATFTCLYCTKKFNDTETLKQHSQTHSGGNPDELSHVPKKFDRKNRKMSHMASPCGKPLLFACKVCTKTFTHMDYLRKHMSTHNVVDLTKISQKNTLHEQNVDITVKQQDITENITISLPDSVKKENRCKETRKNGRSIQDSTGRMFGCTLCLRSFSRRCSLVMHLKGRHNYQMEDFDQSVIPRQFPCPHCQKSFKTKSNLKSHAYTHTGERPFKCTKCPRAFSHSSNLITHMRAHLQIKKYSCQYCDKSFVKCIDQTLHERIHTGEKPYQCEQCGMRFISSSKLSAHGKRHTNVRNYKCDLCDKAFYSAHVLTQHKITHSNERPFQCGVCERTFPRRKTLRTHEQLHSKEKKYVCNVCGKAFAQAAGLYSHRKSHGEKFK